MAVRDAALRCGGIRPCCRPVCLRGPIRAAVTLSPRVAVSLSPGVAGSLSPRAASPHPEKLWVMGERLFFSGGRSRRGGARCEGAPRGVAPPFCPQRGGAVRGGLGFYCCPVSPALGVPGAVSLSPVRDPGSGMAGVDLCFPGACRPRLRTGQDAGQAGPRGGSAFPFRQPLSHRSLRSAGPGQDPLGILTLPVSSAFTV